MNMFIGAGPKRNEPDNPVPAPYLRRVFEIEELPETAPLQIAAVGFYELYVNGENITHGFLAPFISNPDDVIYVDSYEVRPHLRKGKNVIGLLLGNGAANTPGSCTYYELKDARFRTAPSAALRLTIGESVVESDAQFRTHPSPVLSDDYRAGVKYDARQELSGWSLPDYDDSGWAQAQLAPTPRGELVPNTVKPVVVTEEMATVSVTLCETGYLYDFPVDSAGVCRLRLKNTAPGQTITLRHMEKLWPNGLGGEEKEFDHADIEYGQIDTYICKGSELEEWTPPFTYHGFSYVEVTGLTPEQASPDTLTYLELSTEMEQRGSFACSDDRANRICDMALRSARSNFQHVLTDCPHREKNAWTADAALSMEHTLLFMEPENNFRQWLQMLRKAQNEEGALPGYVPTPGHKGNYTSLNGPAWDSAIVWGPYYMWQYRGDLEAVRENTHAIVRYLEYLTTRVRPDGLVSFGLGDWSHAGRGAWLFKAPVELTDTILSMDMCRKAAAMFEAADKPSQAVLARDMYGRFRAAARQRLIDYDTMTAYGKCQTSQAMALHYDLFESGEKPAAFARLLELIRRDGDVMDVGVLGARVLFHVLAAHGHADLAYRLITQSKFPSFGWLVDRGATTLWENLMEPKTKWVDSRNHQFWGDVSHWFIRWLAGIHYNGPERRLDIRPQFIDALDYAEGFHRAPQGDIFVRWERTEKEIHLTLQMPEELSGSICLPDGYTFQDERYDTGVFVKPAGSGEFVIKRI